MTFDPALVGEELADAGASWAYIVTSHCGGVFKTVTEVDAVFAKATGPCGSSPNTPMAKIATPTKVARMLTFPPIVLSSALVLIIRL